LFPTGVTDELQTIDDGVGIMVKTHMGQSWTAWLESSHENGKSNLERMVDGEVPASERRILLTQFLGDAWAHVIANYDMVHSGEKNGCAMDVKGTNLTKIKLQGLQGDYYFGPEHHGPHAAGSSADELEEDFSDLEGAEDAVAQGNEEVELSEEDDDADAEDTEDDTGDGPQHVDKHGNFVLPEAFELVEEPPFDQSLSNFKRLGYRLALKWPYGDDWGWVIGNFKQVCTSGHYKGHFVMRWEDGEETYWPKEPRTTYGPDRKWVLLKHK
jgi:hypothetical protein